MTLVSDNIRFMRIFAGVPWGGERERVYLPSININIYNVHEITYNGRLPDRHTPIYAGHL